MKKYICSTILTSRKMKDGNRTTFQPGDIIEEKFIAPSNVEKYLESGLIKVAPKKPRSNTDSGSQDS